MLPAKHIKQEISKKQPDLDLIEVAGYIRNVTRATIVTYTYQAKSFTDFCKSKGLDIGLDAVHKWVNAGGTVKSQHARLACIKRILREAFGERTEWKRLKDDLDAITLPSPNMAIKRSQYLTSAEVSELQKYVTHRWALIIKALFESGLRISELCAVKRKNCEKVVNKDTGAEWRDINNLVGKGGKLLLVYISEATYQGIITEFDDAGEYLIGHLDGPYNRSYMSRQLTKFGKTFLDKKISAHTFRHSKAMYLANELGLSVYEVQKALNHNRPSTTLENYFHGTPSAERQGIS